MPICCPAFFCPKNPPTFAFTFRNVMNSAGSGQSFPLSHSFFLSLSFSCLSRFTSGSCSLFGSTRVFQSLITLTGSGVYFDPSTLFSFIFPYNSLSLFFSFDRFLFTLISYALFVNSPTKPISQRQFKKESNFDKKRH